MELDKLLLSSSNKLLRRKKQNRCPAVRFLPPASCFLISCPHLKSSNLSATALAR